MIANTLTQLLTQDGFREPLEGRAREYANKADSAVYEALNPSAEEKAQGVRLAIYTAAAYLALC